MSVYNYSQLVNEAGMDHAVNNSRIRATLNNPLGVNYMAGIGTPTSISTGTATTITAAQLLTGIIVINASAAITATFDTAANLVLALNNNSAGAVVGDYYTCLVINGQGTNTITLAAGSGGAYDTNQTASSRIIAGNTSKYVFVRITNVTPGSEAYVIYS